MDIHRQIHVPATPSHYDRRKPMIVRSVSPSPGHTGCLSFSRSRFVALGLNEHVVRISLVPLCFVGWD